MKSLKTIINFNSLKYKKSPEIPGFFMENLYLLSSFFKIKIIDTFGKLLNSKKQ